MTKIFLLTAPFDEDAKTGDGQYAKSLELGFKRNYSHIDCTWLKKDNHDYGIPFPAGATSIPEESIPSATVLQPIANEKTVVSGYKLGVEELLSEEALKVITQTVSPKTPKVILGPENTLHSLVVMDIYSKKPTLLNASTVAQTISALKEKERKLSEAVEANQADFPTKFKAQRAYLRAAYKENKNGIQQYCTLNEYLEAHLQPKDFERRFTKSLNIFKELLEHFSTPYKPTELEKISDKLTGVKDYVYDFYSKNLPYDLGQDDIASNNFDYRVLEASVNAILKDLNELRIRQLVAEKYAYSFKALSSREIERDEQIALINLIHADGFAEIDKEYFCAILLRPATIDHAPLDKIEKAISAYTQISAKLADKKTHVENKPAKVKLIAEWQTLLSKQEEPYLSVNKDHNRFYGKRKFSASEGFHLGYQANQRDPLKPQVITNLIAKMQPIDENTHLDIHIRPPDCGVFITAQDIKAFQRAGVQVNLTIHEYKQNYTRRYLQQYTHDLMRQADTVQFFNQMDMDNAIIAAEYGDCDKRNTGEPTGIAKKRREVGRDFKLDQYPVETYDLRSKSGLTVASQQLSTAPAEPHDVIGKPANILSFGTIRSGKGFEEALQLAQLVKSQAEAIYEKISYTPIVKLAGDPQDKDLMQKIVEERFGESAVAAYQSENSYNSTFSNQARRDYWKKLVAELNSKAILGQIELNNQFIEIYPWCEPHELQHLKDRSKYVCRMDDMGMRNNGSAIISVLDVGVVYTKYGSVTDDIFIRGGQYGDAVDIGKYRYGKYSLLKKAKEFRAQHPDTPLPKWLENDPDSPYKRKPQSRDPQDILDSIIAREENQLAHEGEPTTSDNYKTVMAAQKLLTERFTLKNAVEKLLTNIHLGHLVVRVPANDFEGEVNPLDVIQSEMAAASAIPLPRFAATRSAIRGGLFACRDEERLQNEQHNTIITNIKPPVE